MGYLVNLSEFTLKYSGIDKATSSSASDAVSATLCDWRQSATALPPSTSRPTKTSKHQTDRK
jgi:hypothetical protein